MIFSKSLNKVHLVLLICFIVIGTILIFDVNSRFTKAIIVTNDEENSIVWLGCKVKATEINIYTFDEYNLVYPDDPSYIYAENYCSYGSGIVVYKTEVTNTTDTDVRFSPARFAVAAAFPSAWSNGVMPVNKHGILAPGETKVMEVSTVFTPSLIHASQIDNFRNNRFYLIFSSYPQQVMLEFR